MKIFTYTSVLAAPVVAADINLGTYHASCFPGEYLHEGVCRSCPKGSYSVKKDSAVCVPCQKGYSTAQDGQKSASACGKCPAGKATHHGRNSVLGYLSGASANPSTCEDCPVGHFSSSAASIKCTSCPEGTFNNGEGRLKCQDCETNYVSGTGASKCDPCPAGMECPSKKVSQAVACKAGQISKEGDPKCHDCPDGTFPGNDSLLGSLNIFAKNNKCFPCPAGTASKAGSAKCTACAPGHVSTPGSVACTRCPDGTEPFGGVCRSCSAGSSSNGAVCRPCEAGKATHHNDNVGIAYNFLMAYVSTQQTLCHACPVGYYSTGGADTCTSCDAGKFAAAPGSSVCGVCAAGTLSAPASAVCSRCPAGKQCLTSNLNDATTCPAGHVSPEGDKVCRICEAGTSALGMLGIIGRYFSVPTECHICPQGYYAAKGAATCTACPPGEYAAKERSSRCLRCDEGLTSFGAAWICVDEHHEHHDDHDDHGEH